MTDSPASSAQRPSSSRTPAEHLAVFLATGAWVGLRAPFAPGTWGALWGLPLAWAVGQLPHWGWQLLVIVAVCAIGVPLCTVAARALGAKDPGAVVWDEIASLPITFMLIAPENLSQVWVLAAGFTLHRVFDIVKPPPARQLERLPRGLGIMADDWIAGIYSCLALHLLLWLVGAIRTH